MDNSPFAKLPAELRNEIAGLALEQESPLDLGLIRRDNGLTQTCKQLRAETRTMFWSLNRFELRVGTTRDRKLHRKDIITDRLQFLLRHTLGKDIVSHILQLDIEYVHKPGTWSAMVSCGPNPWHELLTIDAFYDRRQPPSPHSTQSYHKVARRTDVQGSSSSNIQWIVQEYLDMGINLHILDEECRVSVWDIDNQYWGNLYVGHLAAIA